MCTSTCTRVKAALGGVREKQAAADKQEVFGFGAMWFGGPNMALQGESRATIRENNDRLIALASKQPGMMPMVTVHPYEGDAALAELQRVASKGVKVLKIHPHTQQFDAADVRVLALVRRAGELGVIVLMDNASILPGDCEKLFNLALQAPKTRFIFAHLGGMNFRFWNILAAARTAENLFANNIYFDISATVAMLTGFSGRRRVRLDHPQRWRRSRIVRLGLSEVLTREKSDCAETARSHTRGGGGHPLRKRAEAVGAEGELKLVTRTICA